ncbi:hypothetical protein SERLA73DRAFT_61146 [Serpula lacrymans var. lacrymans S7.3]|uniref:Endonuclease/exonuclease/phosphatase domain-containing protein n=1 Tax=Serpula lacrymans var. lacrymans (strain S7.3) TaxID=936435 RepID=F8Q9C5_SERL3|nr:hypothetical protein SERLA73DRAFT_61146 [Serpula lacrymans var. lacrymans S7.3]
MQQESHLEACNTKNYTRPDYVFVSTDLINSFIKCAVVPHLRPVKTDHFPILSMIDLWCSSLSHHLYKYLQRAVNWKKSRETLQTEVNHIPAPREPENKEEFQEVYDHLTSAINRTVNACVPLTKPSLFMKHWWIKDLDKMKTNLKRLARKAHRWRDHCKDPIHKQYRYKCNTYVL